MALSLLFLTFLVADNGEANGTPLVDRYDYDEASVAKRWEIVSAWIAERTI